MTNAGVISIGVKAPLIQEGDELESIIIKSVEGTLNELGMQLQDNDIIGITESIVARSSGTYCSKQDIESDLLSKYDTDTIVLYEPIASRNRFSFILEAISSVFRHVIIVWKNEKDEVGNILFELHPFTGITYYDYYNQIVRSNGATYEVVQTASFPREMILDCRCHKDAQVGKYSLSDICSEISQYGLLGSNLCGKRLKLFPTNAQELVEQLAHRFDQIYKKKVHVLVYGDGCFKDPVGGIWEFADPITCPGTTIPWDLTPKEFKLKSLIDDGGPACIEKAFERITKDQMSSHMGTTPRRVNDLVASLMDLTSGSGSHGTPIVVVKNYFSRYDD